jgi:uncharacterized repeat protein (TIGR02543 family)
LGAETANCESEDGKITGVSDLMEYRLSGETDFIAVSAHATEISNLAAGIYEVRFKETSTHAASEVAPIEVRQYYCITVNVSPTTSIVGGTAFSSPGKAVSGTEITLSETAELGFEFGGWEVLSGGVTIIDNKFTMPANAVEIQANFTYEKYTITFDPNGGTVNPTSGTTGEGWRLAEGDLLTPTRAGYAFNGWFLAETGGMALPLSHAYSAHTTIYAQWTALNSAHTVTLNLNGGSYDRVRIYTAGSGSWSGWHNGIGTTQRNRWFNCNNGTKTISHDGGFCGEYLKNWASTSHLYGDITFPESSSDFVLTFDFIGVGEMNRDYMTLRYSGTNFIPTEGFVFSDGIILGTNYWNDFAWSQKTVILPAATFSGRTIRLVFTWINDSFGGSDPAASIDNINITAIITTVTTGSGDRLTSLPMPPTKTGYEFNGWFTSQTGGEKVTEGTIFTENTTIFAQWTPAYIVTFNATGGSVSPATGTAREDGTLASLPEEPTRTGFNFAGWFTEETGGEKVTTSTVFTENTTIYAQWAIITYEITFAPNGGIVTPASGTTGEGWRLKKEDLPTPTWGSYFSFVGWFTEVTGGTRVTEYTVFDENTTIYAQWANIYSVTFDANDGTTNHEIRLTRSDHTLESLPVPTRTGFTFLGWFTAATGGTQVTTSRIFTTNSTVYARWTSSVSNVIFMEDFGGSNSFTIVNGSQTNQWHVGTATRYSGTRSAYISNNGGISNQYSINSPSVVHMFRNVTFPASTVPCTLSFYWKSNGENTPQDYDFLRVFLVETSFTPIAGSLPSGIGIGTYKWSNNVWTQVRIVIPASNNGTTRRLVFTWVNDGSVGTQPPAAVDNIMLVTGGTSTIITFDPNGGWVTPTTGTTNINGTLTSLPIPTRSGFAFNGWFTEETGGEEVTTSTLFSENTTIFAQWTPAYTVTFDPNGDGGAVNPTTQLTGAGGRLVSLPVPTRTGFFFAGWFTEETGGEEVTTDMPFTEDATVYARWTSSVYLVMFNANGGDLEVHELAASTVGGGRLASLPTPTRTGYAFNGWFTATTGGDEVTTSTVFSANATVHAQWTPVYTVTFDPNGGTVSLAIGLTVAGGKLTSLPTPARHGYAFDGWFTEETGGTEVTISTVFEANTTIYAQWTFVYTVIFDATGGTVSPAFGITGVGGKLAFLPTPVKTGYTFVGWFTTAAVDGTEVTTNTVFGVKTTIYARWTLTFYEITFNPTGGTVSPEAGTTDTGWTLVGILPEPTKAGYNFIGWFTAETGGTEVTESRVYTENTTIYARWTIIPYTITFDASPSTVSPTSGTTGAGWRLTSLPTPASRSGHAFDGWFTAATGGEEVTTNTVFNANTTIYAQWTPFYVVIFDANGGTVNPIFGTTGARGRLVTLPVPTRDNYAFDGWFTAAVGGTEVTTNTEFTESGTTIYAQWTTIYTVTFDASGGTVSPTSHLTGAGRRLGSLPIPTRTDYIFVGWFTAATGGDEVTTSTSFSENTTVYARWIITITFDANGGEVALEFDTVADDGTVSLPTPTRVNHTFLGWFTSVTGGTEVTENTVFNANTTIFARWVLNIYTVTFVNENGNRINVQTVSHGLAAIAPNISVCGWDIEFNNVTSNLTVTAIPHAWTAWIEVDTTFAGVCVCTQAIQRRVCRREENVQQFRVVSSSESRCEPDGGDNNESKLNEYGIFLERNIVANPTTILVRTPESATANIVILDNLGNTVFVANNVETKCFAYPNCGIIWNLTNFAGRFVANGTYLIIVEAKGNSGKSYRYSARIGVQR